ncbi:type IV secretory system conjugative DNA transfer family protein, partial [Bacillus thuringiensis]|uniref:type IV secretory system conjugative DNA transfer family protein n=1 Tax=Bacillus thuringiensis TaxID=1428 RepID=UPI0021B3FBD2
MKVWKLKWVGRFWKYSRFELCDIGKGKMGLYVVIGVGEGRYGGLINTFFGEVFEEVYGYGDRNDNELDVGVGFLVDEFGKMGRIADFV